VCITVVASIHTCSFSIWDGDNLSLVFDSANALESLLKEPQNAKYFNSAHDKLDVDDRSDNKVSKHTTMSSLLLANSIGCVCTLSRSSSGTHCRASAAHIL
jgi:hypothetical protein